MTQKDTCTPMFIAVLSTIAKTWKQSKYPLKEEWIKMWHIYATECLHIYAVDYYLAIKGKEIVPFAEMWMGLETVILSEVRKTYHDDITYMWNQKKGGYK